MHSLLLYESLPARYLLINHDSFSIILALVLEFQPVRIMDIQKNIGDRFIFESQIQNISLLIDLGKEIVLKSHECWKSKLNPTYHASNLSVPS